MVTIRGLLQNLWI